VEPQDSPGRRVQIGSVGRAASGPSVLPSRRPSSTPGAVAPLPESARANYDAAVATYRQTSLTAFQEVEDNVAALRILENETQQQEEAVAHPRTHFNFLQKSLQRRRDTYLQVITAQTIELTNERNAIDIQRRRLDASVLLIKALGGGWTCPIFLRSVRPPFGTIEHPGEQCSGHRC